MADTKADELMAEAEKKLKAFTPFTAKEEKLEKARDRFLLAATMYKASGNFQQAANAYLRAVDMAEKLKSDLDIAEDSNNAALALVKCGNKERATETLGRVVDLYDKMGKYSQAAKVCMTVADIGGEDAMDWLQRAARYYKDEGSKVTAQEITLRMAGVHIQKGQLESARNIYERIAKDALDDRLSRGGARKLFFMALLCQVAMLSPTNLSEQISVLADTFREYQELDMQFDQHTREHMLITGIIAAVENDDIEAYAAAVDEYDNICPLDDVKTKLLLRGKQALRKNDLR